jgi:hypothetical protein
MHLQILKWYIEGHREFLQVCALDLDCGNWGLGNQVNVDTLTSIED